MGLQEEQGVFQFQLRREKYLITGAYVNLGRAFTSNET